jgi:Cu(I)/Ag(I) efflux system membrane fusion protein
VARYWKPLSKFLTTIQTNEIKKMFFLAIVVAALSACNNNAEKRGSTTTISNSTTITDTSHHTMSSAIYQCPMDTEVTSDKPGTCPKCGMELELKK